MTTYNICIVDEASSEVDYIKRAIIENAPVDENIISFSSIDIDQFETEESIASHLLELISKMEVNLIIIDYKLNTRKSKLFDGNTIFDYLEERLSRFPLLILTNKPDDCANEAIVDPDKIYPKSAFTDISSVSSSLLVKKLFQNIDIYLNRLKEIETLEKEIQAKSSEESDIKKILECDEKMDKVLPDSCLCQSSRRIFDESFFDELSKELQEAKELIKDLYGQK